MCSSDLVAGGKERKIDSASSGERKWKSLNRSACITGLRTALSTDEITGIVLEKLAKKRESRVREN